MNLLPFSFLLLYFTKCLFAGNESNPPSPEYDWTEFLNLSPPHQHDSHQGQSSASTSPPKSTTLSTNSDILTVTEKKLILSPHKVIDKKAQMRHKKVWQREKTRFQNSTLKEKEEMLASKRARQARYNARMKEKYGYKSKSIAKFHQIQNLEKLGQASEEQIQFLNKERDRVRAIRRESKRRCKEKQAAKKNSNQQ